MMNEPVSAIMSKNIITIRPDTKLSKVKELFLNKHIHHVLVTEKERLVGILTTYDLLKVENQGADYNTIPASDIMTTKLAIVDPGTKVGTAAELFLYNKFHALPVVTAEQELVGLVTSFDVLAYEFKKAYPNPILHADLYEKYNNDVL